MTVNATTAAASASLPTPPTDYLFHPTLTTTDRGKVRDFIRTLFGVEGIYQRQVTTDPRLAFNPDYPVDYSFHAWLADMWLDAIQPDLYRIEGSETAPPTMWRLVEMAWFVDDIPAVLRASEKQGIRVTNQYGQAVSSDRSEGAQSAASPEFLLLWLHPEDTGFAIELCRITPVISPYFAELCYPPLADGWRSPAPVGPNPLGIEVCSHHTLLTDNVARGLRWSIDVLGGKVVHQGRNESLETESTYVWLGKALIEFAQPSREGSQAWRAWQDKSTSLAGLPQEDVYHSISFKVRDLVAARAHIAAAGLQIEHNGEHSLLLDRTQGLGVCWGFSDRLIPGDPRN